MHVTVLFGSTHMQVPLEVIILHMQVPLEVVILHVLAVVLNNDNHLAVFWQVPVFTNYKARYHHAGPRHTRPLLVIGAVVLRSSSSPLLCSRAAF